MIQSLETGSVSKAAGEAVQGLNIRDARELNTTLVQTASGGRKMSDGHENMRRWSKKGSSGQTPQVVVEKWVMLVKLVATVKNRWWW